MGLQCNLSLDKLEITAKPYIMQDDEFEWDDAKAAINYRDHKITFEQARLAFADVFAIEREDRRKAYGEARYNLIGMAEGHVLHVTYTWRGQRIRIISARLAEPKERRRYHDENTEE